LRRTPIAGLDLSLRLRLRVVVKAYSTSIMHQPRLGYNAKARGSTVGGKKKRKRRGQTSGVTLEQGDPNATIHVPKTTEEKEMEKKERMKQEVCLLNT